MSPSASVAVILPVVVCVQVLVFKPHCAELVLPAFIVVWEIAGGVLGTVGLTGRLRVTVRPLASVAITVTMSAGDVVWPRVELRL